MHAFIVQNSMGSGKAAPVNIKVFMQYNLQSFLAACVCMTGSVQGRAPATFWHCLQQPVLPEQHANQEVC